MMGSDGQMRADDDVLERECGLARWLAGAALYDKGNPRY